MSIANTPLEVAEACLKMMELHEKSWSKKKQAYLKDETDCAKEACKLLGVAPAFWELIYLATSSWPNDIADWAKELIEK